MKRFGIIGLGNFGGAIARELAGLDCKVTVIDSDEDRARRLADIVDTALVADGTLTETLEKLGVEGFDTWIVSTGRDPHASILATLHLKELGATRIVAKANSADHARILEKVGASRAVIPEEQMAVRVAHSLAQSDLVDFLPLGGEHIVAEVPSPASFAGRQLDELQVRRKHRVAVVAVRRSGGGLEPAPAGDHVVDEEEAWIVLGRERDIDRLRELD